MCVNIIDAIINLTNNPVKQLVSSYKGNNRANNEGDALEEYIKNLFANTFDVSESERIERQKKVFSYLGNNNNPPDAMLRNGDAIEIKKIEKNTASLALNSSYPKHKLNASSYMISAECRSAEDWIEKDIIYAVGVVNKKDHQTLKSLCMVYGMDYCASKNHYEIIKVKIESGVKEIPIPGIEFADSKELGRINRIDPFGITNLRIRPMWEIKNPWSVFNYVYERDKKKDFNFMCIINDEKWSTFYNTQKLLSLSETDEALTISDVQIRNPDNPEQLVDAKLITYST